MKVDLGTDELYPYFSIDPSYDGGFEITEEFFNLYTENMKEFNRIQTEIEKMIKARHAEGK